MDSPVETCSFMLPVNLMKHNAAWIFVIPSLQAQRHDDERVSLANLAPYIMRVQFRSVCVFASCHKKSC